MRFLKRAICVVMVAVLLLTLQPVTVEAASYKNTYRNTGNHRLDIIGVALTQVGYTEGANNANKYGYWFQMNNEPWCAIFVSWCAREAGIPTSILRNSSLAVPNETIVDRNNDFGIDYFDGKEYTPQPGDLFFTKIFSHVGLVAWVDGEYFYTVEGNSNTAGSNNGDRVVCNRREIKDYYFGVPEYDTSVEEPAGPVITADRDDYREGENETGDTIQLSWEGSEEDVSRRLVIYYKGNAIVNQDVGLDTKTYTLENAMAGGYMAVVSATRSDGSTVYTRYPIDVKEPYALTMRYHTGDASVAPGEKYEVTADILYLRSQPNTSSTRLSLITKGEIVTVSETQVVWDELWGKTQYGKFTGYIAIRSSTAKRTGYYSDESGLLYAYSTEEPAVTRWEYGQGSETAGLMDVEEFGLEREHYTFVGWSETADGSGVIYRQDDTTLTAQQIRPEFRYEDITIDLYAIWQKNVAAISVQTPPEKTNYYTGEAIDTTGLALNVTYTDGTAETITEGFTVRDFSSLNPGEKTVRILYNNASTSLTVSVMNRLLYTADEAVVTVDGYVGASGDLLLPSQTESKPVTGISEGAFRDNTQITGILIPSTVTTIGNDAFAGCTSLTDVYFTGTQEQWDALVIGTGNEALLNANIHVDFDILGDIDGNRIVDEADVLYLLRHLLFAEEYVTDGFTDLTQDGVTNEDDVLYLLRHLLFQDTYPL